jgi:hypothetical protein
VVAREEIERPLRRMLDAGGRHACRLTGWEPVGARRAVLILTTD